MSPVSSTHNSSTPSTRPSRPQGDDRHHYHTLVEAYKEAGQVISIGTSSTSIVGRARHSPSDRHEMERWRDALPSSTTSTSTSTSTSGRNDASMNERMASPARTISRARSTLVSLGLLSLLPVQAGARPAGRDRASSPATSSSQSTVSSIPSSSSSTARWTPDGYLVRAKRDRRRSTERLARNESSNEKISAVVPGHERSTDRFGGKQIDIEATPRWITRTSPPLSSMTPTPPSHSSKPRSTHAPPLLTQYRRDGIPPAEPTSTPTPTTESTFHRITVPNSVLPYLLTTDSDGQIGTANWELYGRVAQDPSIVGRAEESTMTITTSLLDPTEPEPTPFSSTAGSVATQVAAADADGMDTTFLITDALPRGWGIESDRGDLYAVPLITVASVCLAAVIFCFIVITVVSRAKAKRRRARRERKRAQQMKSERARQTTAERGDHADHPGNGATTGERFRDEESSLGDEENGIGDIIRSERVAGQADQQRSNGGRYSAADSDAERDDVLEQKFKAAGQGNRAKVRRVVSVGVTRLGNGRVLEWRKGLRKRKTMSNATAPTQAVETPVQPILIDRREGSNRPGVRERSSTSLVEGSGEGSSTTAVDSEARVRAGESASIRGTTSEGRDGTESPASTLPSDLPLTRTMSRAMTRTTESGDQAPLDAPIADPSRSPGAPSGEAGPPTTQASVTFAAPHFPPAYYRTASAHGSSSPRTGSQELLDALPRHGEMDGSTSVQGGPAAASARALEKRPANYYPAPTTADQEDAVAVAFGHTGVGRSSGVEDGPSSHPPDIGARHQTVGDTAVTGHLATDDKGVLEQLRNAASMPVPSDEPPMEEPLSMSNHIGRDATAPALDVDEEGFERLDAEHSAIDPVIQSNDYTITSSLPTPPRPVLQASYVAAPSAPSAPSFRGVISEAPALDLASAPLAEDDLPEIGPSAPSAEDETPVERQDNPDSSIPSAPTADDIEGYVESSAPIPGVVAQPTPAARASHARRSLGLDLPTEDHATATAPTDESIQTVPTTRFLPKYEP